MKKASNPADGWQFIPELINLHKQGKFPIEKISKVYPVADLERAISDMKDGTVRSLTRSCAKLN